MENELEGPSNFKVASPNPNGCIQDIARGVSSHRRIDLIRKPVQRKHDDIHRLSYWYNFREE